MEHLYKKLSEYSNTDSYPLHMPGHKRQGMFLPDDDILGKISKIDITEIDGFDNLHEANSVIKDLQDEAGKIYGSSKTYVLINGSTSGILSAISSVYNLGDTLVVGRNCHKSVYNAAFLNGFDLEYICPKTNEEYGFSEAITEEDVHETIDRVIAKGKKIAAVVITTVTYEGLVSNTESIGKLVHQYNIPLIADEAHGAHLGLFEGYPNNSVKYADIVIHSLHKTLPAFTQTALIHINSNIVSSDVLERYLKIYQTSSPSYILMASVDRCIEFLRYCKGEEFHSLLTLRSKLEEELKNLKALKYCNYTEPCKIVISTRNAIISGVELADILRREYHIEVEMASLEYIIGIVSICDTEDGILRFIDAIKKIDAKLERSDTMPFGLEETEIPEVSLSLQDAYRSPYACKEIDDAVGTISADYVILYPPGSPIIVPGEVYNKDIVNKIKICKEMGLNVQGLENNKVRIVQNG